MRLKQIREARKMSQKDLAAAMSVNQSAVSQWETGECTPTYSNLLKLTRVLSCTLPELAGSENEKTSA